MRARSVRNATAGLLLTQLAVLSGCAPAGPRGGGRVPVTVATVESRTVPYELDATGTVEPLASADVIPQVGGMVSRLAFREGDDVREGQVLVEIEPRVFEAEVARTAAILERDRAQARTAQLELERAERLAEQQLLSTGDLDAKRAAAQALAATVLADSASLARARLDLAHATVRAPIGGRTGRLSVHVGDVVRANDPASALVTIHRLRPIRVRFTIPQAHIAEVRGERQRDVRVRVFSGLSDSAGRDGALAFVDNQVDPASGTLLLKGEFPNQDAALWPGAFVRVRVQLREQHGATVVPASAVTNSQSGPYCYVVRSDTTVELRPVTVARSWRELTVVSAGLSPGETVVTDGQVRLTPGAKAVIRAGAGADGAATPAAGAGTSGAPAAAADARAAEPGRP